KGSAGESLYRSPVEIVGSEIQIGVVVRTGRTSGLYRGSALLVVLQVEAIVEAGIDVFEVSVRCYAKAAIVTAQGLRNVGAAKIRALPRSTGVLVDECD